MGRGACVPGARCAGQRATGCAREAVKVNAMIYAFTRPEQRTWMGNILLPAGAPCEARGSAACATAALFWVLFWCQKSTAAHAFRIRAVWRVVIFRRWSSRGQAAIERCVPFFAKRSVAKDPLTERTGARQMHGQARKLPYPSANSSSRRWRSSHSFWERST